MNYILKVYNKSKYLGFKRYEYKEFDSYGELMSYIHIKNIKYEDYIIYVKVIY